MTCQSNSVACTSCSYNISTSTFKCLTCDSSLNRTLDTVLSKCVCQTGYYEDSAFTCQLCSVGCLACSFDGVNSICSSCDSSINRVMGTANLSCDCRTGFYLNANGTCSACPTGCLSCSLNLTNPICATCVMGYYLNGGSICTVCSIGCFNCQFNISTSS